MNLRSRICALVVLAAFLPVVAVAEEEEPPVDPVAKAVTTANEKLLGWQTKDAREALEAVKDRADSHAGVAAAMAQVLVQEKKYADAVKQMEAAAKLAPADAALQVALGDSYLLLKRTDEANAAFRRAATLAAEALKENDKDLRALFIQAQAQQRLREFDKAAAGFAKVVEASAGSDVEALYELGVTNVLRGKWQEAVDALTKALEKNKGIAYAYYYRGLAAEKLGRKDLLINDMGRFLALAPNAPEASRAQAILNAAKR
jgi:tetratricopeptide (TPR) repeat protein